MMLRSLVVFRAAWTPEELIPFHINTRLSRGKDFTMINFRSLCTGEQRIKMFLPLVLSRILGGRDSMLGCETEFRIVFDLDGIKMPNKASFTSVSCHFDKPARSLMGCHESICVHCHIHRSNLSIALGMAVG